MFDQIKSNKVFPLYKTLFRVGLDDSFMRQINSLLHLTQSPSRVCGMHACAAATATVVTAP
jgi:hypothetical protein